MQRRERTFLQTLAMPSHFWLPLLPFYFKRFLVPSSSSQAEEKKRKTIKKKKNAEKGGSLPLSFRFALSLLILASDFLFPPFRFKRFFFGIFFFSSKRKKEKP
jgi:hypothetical protein